MPEDEHITQVSAPEYKRISLALHYMFTLQQDQARFKQIPACRLCQSLTILTVLFSA